MNSMVKVSEHPVHPMLVGFPITLYSITLAAYVVFTVCNDPFWFRVGFAANVAGIAMAVLASIPGFFHWLLGIPRQSEAKGVGARHLSLNLVALTLFTADAWLYDGYWNVPPTSVALGIALAAIGLSVTLLAGWLGWTMVQEQHVGVTLVPQPARIDYIEDHRRAA